MAGPAYKPLAVNVQGSLPGVFDTAAIDFQDAQKQAEALQAQELANQINEIAAQRAQQNFDDQNQLRESLKQQFGQQEDGTTPNFDPNAALETAMRLAGQQGDLDSMLNVTKAQRTLSGDRELTDVEAMQLGVPQGTTLSVAKAMQRSQDLNLERARFDDPLRIQNRTLDATLKEQATVGGQIRPMRAPDAIQLGELEEFGKKVDNVRDTYMPYISENRGERFLAAAVNPNSAAGRMKNELDLIATELAAAYNGSRLSDLDFRTMSKLVNYGELDTLGTISDKFDRLKDFTSMKHDTMLESLEKANFNVSNFKAQGSDPITAGANSANAPIMIPKVGAPSGAGNLSAEESAYKEQYKAKLRAQRGL